MRTDCGGSAEREGVSRPANGVRARLVCKHHRVLSRVLITVVIAAIGCGAIGCGEPDRQVSPEDRAALDRFSDGVRQWRREGTEPWNKALAAGNVKLAEVAPKAEASMKKAIAAMESAANDVSEPKVRAALQRMVATYRAKLASVHKVDNAGYSLTTLKEGLNDLKADGKETLKAWNAYVKQAKQAWNANPLAGLNVG